MPGSPGDRPYDAFYELTDPVSDPPFRGRFGASGDESVLFSRGESRPSSAVAAWRAMGSPSPSDVIWTTSVGPLIISQRVIRLLEAGGFTGVHDRKRVPAAIGLRTAR